MKRYWFPLAGNLALVLGLGVTACAGPATIAPPTIHYGEDVCDQCNMIISEERFAAATIVELSEGRTDSRIFDDIGGMFLYHLAHPELKVLARYVHDYETKEWLAAGEAIFVRSEEVHSPMGHGIIACSTRDQAERLAAGLNGQVLAYDELVALAEAGTFAGPHMQQDTGHMDHSP